MWFLLAVLHVFFMALVNYIDEFLTAKNEQPEGSDIHTEIGGLLLISTILSLMGAFVISFVVDINAIPTNGLVLAIASGVPMAVMYAAYFYLLTIYPVHQVEPLFQIGSIWLLILELSFGGSISLPGLVGIIFLIAGAYLLDAGTIRWKVPTKLLMTMIPATTTWAGALFLVREASRYANPDVVTFWQYLTIGIIGVVLFITVKKYRQGLLFRIQNQGKTFLGLSLVNESFAQLSYFFGNLAVAIAPVASFIPAMGGLQHVFVLVLFFLFPISKRNKITRVQALAIVLIMIGVVFVEVIRPR